jgi:predicted HD phosphohydrolase
MNEKYKQDAAKNQAQRVLDMLRRQEGAHTQLGAPVDLYQHALQTATRAHNDGAAEELIVAALLHDVGELLSPSNHGDIVASILEPYVSPRTTWVLRHHEIFQVLYAYCSLL